MSILRLPVDSMHYNTLNLHHNWKCEAPVKLHQPDYYLSLFLILLEIPQRQLLVKAPGISFFFSEKKISRRNKTKRI